MKTNIWAHRHFRWFAFLPKHANLQGIDERSQMLSGLAQETLSRYAEFGASMHVSGQKQSGFRDNYQVVANGVIYGNVSLGGSLSPYLYAFRATGCGHPSCSPLWIIHLPVGIGTGGPIESPVIANGVVYFSESDQVFTFHLPGTAP